VRARVCVCVSSVSQGRPRKVKGAAHRFTSSRGPRSQTSRLFLSFVVCRFVPPPFVNAPFFLQLPRATDKCMTVYIYIYIYFIYIYTHTTQRRRQYACPSSTVISTVTARLSSARACSNRAVLRRHRHRCARARAPATSALSWSVVATMLTVARVHERRADCLPLRGVRWR